MSIISDEITHLRKQNTVSGVVHYEGNGDTVYRTGATCRRSLEPHFLIATLSDHCRHCRWFDSYKIAYDVGTLPHSLQMSSHNPPPTTPPKDPKFERAIAQSNQATKPNKGSSASGQLLPSITWVSKRCKVCGVLTFFVQ